MVYCCQIFSLFLWFKLKEYIINVNMECNHIFDAIIRPSARKSCHFVSQFSLLSFSFYINFRENLVVFVVVL